MTSNHFFVKQNNLHTPHALIDEREHHHLSRVLRIKTGERVWLVDELGISYWAEVEEVGLTQTRLLILEKKEPLAGKMRMTLAQALIKSKNMDLVIQKATELGVDVVIPIAAVRSVVRLGEGGPGKRERWLKIAAEAAKQSRRSAVPSILAPQPLASFLQTREEARKFILCERGGVPLKDILAAGTARPGGSGVVVLVGPEGGWTKDEQEQAVAKDFEAVSLGSHILRSETAALAVLAAISIFWGG